jgi:hypothetical protein
MEEIKETLEEAARNYFRRGQLGYEKAADTETAFIKGGLWMQERMYSKEELHKCKYCGVETTQPDEECYAKPTKTMTAVEWLKDKLQQYIDKGSTIDDLFNKAFEMEKQQRKQIVLNILHHELGHDETARWIAERLEAGEIDVNDL